MTQATAHLALVAFAQTCFGLSPSLLAKEQPELSKSVQLTIDKFHKDVRRAEEDFLHALEQAKVRAIESLEEERQQAFKKLDPVQGLEIQKQQKIIEVYTPESMKKIND